MLSTHEACQVFCNYRGCAPREGYLAAAREGSRMSHSRGTSSRRADTEACRRGTAAHLGRQHLCHLLGESSNRNPSRRPMAHAATQAQCGTTRAKRAGLSFGQRSGARRRNARHSLEARKTKLLATSRTAKRVVTMVASVCRVHENQYERARALAQEYTVDFSKIVSAQVKTA